MINEINRLPETLPGIDIKTAIKSFGGNQHLFIKVVSEFIKRYAQLPDQIATALNNHDMELAQRLSHTIKGVSGMIHATDLFHASKDLEFSIKNNQNSNYIQSIFHVFKISFDNVLKSATHIGCLINESVDESDRCKHKPIQEPIESLIINLFNFLKKNNPKAEKLLHAIKPRLTQLGFEKEVNMIESHMDQYNFVSSCNILKSIAIALNITIADTSEPIQHTL